MSILIQDSKSGSGHAENQKPKTKTRFLKFLATVPYEKVDIYGNLDEVI